MYSEYLAIVLTPFALGIPLLYPVYCWGAKRRLPIFNYELLLCMATTYLVFVVLEASFGFIHYEILGWRIWEYRMLPNHRGYGTDLGPVMWSLYGIHVYWFRQVMRNWVHFKNPWVKGGFTAVEGPVFEFVGNGIILLIYGQYLFYYFPSDLMHLTTFKVMPHYAIAGVIFGYFMNAMDKAPKSWGLPISLFIMGLCVTILG